jgi:small subunit ribosomal protein S6
VYNNRACFVIFEARESLHRVRAVPFSPQGGENMTNYEIMFIIDPTLEEEKKNATVEKVQEIIKTGEGEVSNVDVWGMKKLAYPIEKKNEGYYVVIEFQAGIELPKELDRRLKISDDVMRHMIINKDAK